MTKLAFSLALLAGLTAHQAQSPDPASFPPSTVPLAQGLGYVDPLTLHAPRNFLNDFPTRQGELVTAVIEIPAGYCEKWEVKADGLMRWDIKDGKPRQVKYLGYPCNYGMLPRTRLGKELGGDGDPLDVLVLGPALPRGTVVAVRVLGTIRLVDAGERDDKLVAVVPGSPLDQAKSVSELESTYPGITTILRAWFENYKGKGALQCSGFGEPAVAEELVRAAESSFERR
ncbi:MAG: inorganic diphosphatase [Planctomycetes bacterium]|nr:inorganic diphosphatase [Planctomycetota bacterium]